MTNFIEEQQREAGKKYPEDKSLEYYEGSCAIDQEELAELVQQTITNTLNHILESGLLEEKEEHQDWCKLTGELEYSSCGCWKDHNTLARAVKAHLDELINPTK